MHDKATVAHLKSDLTLLSPEQALDSLTACYIRAALQLMFDLHQFGIGKV